MNKILLTLFASMIVMLTIQAQVAPSFKYQGVARNASNAPLVNQSIGLQLSILNASGVPVYVERHAVTTSALGIFSVNVCNGSNATGSCATIDWGAGQFNLKVEMDPAGGTAFVNMGNSPILMAPIAAYALKSGGSSGDNDGSPTNELQDLTFTEATGLLGISQRNSVNLSGLKNDADADPTNEIQTISLDTSDNSLILSKNGGRIVIPGAAPIWTKSGDSISYKHSSTVGLIFSPSKNETRFGPEVWSRKFATTNKWYDEFRTKPSNLGKEVAFGAEIVEYPITFNRFYLRVNADTFWKAHTYNYTLGGTSGGALTQTEHFSQFLNGTTPVKALSNRMESYAGVGSSITYFGGVAGTLSGHAGLNGALHSITAHVSATGHSSGNPSNFSLLSGFWLNRSTNQSTVTADVKNFHIPYPKQAGKELWYACIEGPEAGAYERGTATLVNGEAFVLFTEHFEYVINPETATVSITPLSADSEGIAVIEKTAKGFRVKELRKGAGNYKFDWEVKAVRKGYENYEVIRDPMIITPVTNDMLQDALQKVEKN